MLTQREMVTKTLGWLQQMEAEGKTGPAHRNFIKLCENYRSMVVVMSQAALAPDLETAQALLVQALSDLGELEEKIDGE